MPVLFFSFFSFRQVLSELPPPIAVKLCHMIGNWFDEINLVQKFGGTPPPKKKWGSKTCKSSGDFLPLLTLIANISGMEQDIENRKDI